MDRQLWRFDSREDGENGALVAVLLDISAFMYILDERHI